jgi:hypothetical protein
LEGGSDANYDINLINGTLTIDKANQTISFDAIEDVDIASTSTVALVASASSGLEVAFNLAEGDGSIAGTTLTVNSTGYFEIEVSQGGNTNYNAATSVSQGFTANDSRKSNQTITFNSIADKQYGDFFNLTATASSGLSITYTLVSGSADLSGAQLTLTGLGTVTVRASQAGDATYNPAASVTRSFEVGQAALTVAVDDKQITYGDALPSLTYSVAGYINGDDASVIAGTISVVTDATATSGVGTYAITASGGSATNYALSYVSGSLVITKAGQAITFNPLSAATYGDADFDLTASSSSGLAVSYTSSDEAVATISGTTVTIVGAGTATITARQAGDANYEAGADVTQALTVNKASQSIEFAAIAEQLLSTATLNLTATASSGLPVSYTADGPAVVEGTTLTFTGAGEVTVVASQPGNGNYEAAGAVSQTFVIADDTPVDPVKQDQTIILEEIADKTFGDEPFELTASASSGLSVSYAIAEGPATVEGAVVTITGAGSVTITARQPGNESFNPALDVSRTFTVHKATATVTLSGLEQEADGDAKPVTVITTPADLVVVVTYDGTDTAPSTPGSYAVLATVTDANYQGSANGTLVLTEAIETGLQELAGVDIKAYPNPIIHEMTIEFPADTPQAQRLSTLYDLQGREQLQVRFSTLKYSLNLQQQVGGIYLLVITDGEGVLLKRVKVKKE